jgi:hypothetical protein
MPEHIHWEGPSPSMVLAALAVVLVLVAALTWVVQHNCTTFHVCSDIIRDRPHVYQP